MLYIVSYRMITENITNQTNITNISTTCDSCKDGTNEISYGIFVFLFAVFVVFILLGIFFFVERVILKNKKRCKDWFKLFWKYTLLSRKIRHIRPKPRKKRMSNNKSV